MISVISPVVYASGMSGIAGDEPGNLSEDLEPLFEAIVREVPPPQVNVSGPSRMQVCALDYDEHKGRIAIRACGPRDDRQGRYRGAVPAGCGAEEG